MKFFLLVLMFSPFFSHAHSLGQDSSEILAHEEKFLVRFNVSHDLKKYLLQNDYDIAGVDLDLNTIDVLATKEQMLDLQKFKVSFDFEVPQVYLRGPDPEYQTAESIEQKLRDFSEKFPNFSQLIKIGESVEGRSIWALKISDNPLERELEEPTILFNSMHHAREVMTPEVGLDIIEYLLIGVDQDSEVRNWVNNNEIWVVPMLNVDGNNKMWTQNHMWRKNTQGGHGVDLNRNYPTGWDSCSGSSGSTRSDTYRGPSPASEPETKSLMTLVEKIKPVFNISYHSYSELVIYPFGCRPHRTTTKSVVESIGKELGMKLGYRAGTAWELLYNADGGDIDWMYKEQQVIPYVLELNRSREGFHPNYKEWRDKTVQRNRVGWQLLLDRLSGPGVRGIESELKGGIIEVRTEKEVIQSYKINPDGTYHLILEPGKYSLSFKLNNKVIKSQQVEISNMRVDLF